MAIIKEIYGMVVVHNVTEAVSVSNTAVTGFLVVYEGEITKFSSVGTTQHRFLLLRKMSLAVLLMEVRLLQTIELMKQT